MLCFLEQIRSLRKSIIQFIASFIGKNLVSKNKSDEFNSVFKGVVHLYSRESSLFGCGLRSVCSLALICNPHLNHTSMSTNVQLRSHMGFQPQGTPAAVTLITHLHTSQGFYLHWELFFPGVLFPLLIYASPILLLSLFYLTQY